MLVVKELSVAIQDRSLVSDLSLRVSPGEWWMVLGPNGSGKSMLLKALLGQIAHEGEVFLKGKPLITYSDKERAQSFGVLAQHSIPIYGFTVEEVVAMGRYPYQETTSQTQLKVEEALEMMDLMIHTNRAITELSGGEIQRVYLAQVLAQDPDILILDEPNNHLDLNFQKQLYELLNKWRQVKERAIITVTHDLLVARRFGSHGLLLQGDSWTSQGKMSEVIQKENLQKAYSLDVVQWLNDNYRSWFDES